MNKSLLKKNDKMKSEDLKQIVKEKYGKIAEQSNSEKSSCCSSSCCGPEVDYTVFSENYESKEGYNPDADLNLGCGIPTDYAGIKKGDHVLDLGSGAGNDCFVARAIVGENGKVIGLDMTEPMVLKARENCAKLNFKNVEFVLGDIEKMPFDDKLFNVVISNCVLNLVPDKSKAFKEIFRVLKPGGHFCVSDVVLKGILSDKMKKDAEMYAGCVSGASEMNEYLKIIENSGFLNAKVHKQKEIKLPDSLLSEYNDENELKSYHEGDTGIFSITVSAEKPVGCSCGGIC
jgi:SAM-dependent methyltransferase